ncbi:MAG: hypothetical protein ALECFALPRED_001448 [Alectoria fallacina]|uniref:Uncharacterized protein n=1 Tax=Alectoria fallacina TaxID=1903189 RepID=A0A8H3JAD9_9LECA|nr:MAG: hypothetical protein ALECFALPRED_001448 [Alectoria fallacina]
MAGNRVHGGERLPEWDPEWLKKKLSEFRASIAQSKGSIVENMIKKGPGILKSKSRLNRQSLNGRRLRLWSIEAKAELDEEPSYKLNWHFAGVEVLDNTTLNRVLTEYREKDQMAYGSTTFGNNGEAARMTAPAKHISILDATTLEDVFGPLAKGIEEAIENGFSAQVLIKQGKAGFNGLCRMHGGVEGVLNIKESAFEIKTPKESPHPVRHEVNLEHIVHDLARLGMAGGKAVDSVPERFS